MTKLLILLLTVATLASCQVNLVSGEFGFFELQPNEQKAYTLNVNLTSFSALVLNAQSLDEGKLSWQVLSSSKDVIDFGSFDITQTFSKQVQRFQNSEFFTSCPGTNKENCTLSIVVLNKDSKLSKGVVSFTTEEISQSGLATYSPILYNSAINQKLHSISVGYKNTFGVNQTTSVKKYQIVATQAVNTTFVYNFKQAVFDNSSFAILSSKVADPLNYTFPEFNETELNDFSLTRGLNTYKFGLLENCTGEVDCTWAFTLYVASPLDTFTKDNNGFYFQLKNLNEFITVQQNKYNNQTSDLSQNEVFLYFKIASDLPFVGIHLEDDRDVINNNEPQYVIAVQEDGQLKTMKEFFKEGSYKIINQGKYEIYIFHYAIGDEDDDGGVEFSDFDDDVNDLDLDDNVKFTNDNRTAYLLYTVKEWQAAGLHLTITSQEKFDEVFKGAKIFIVACERSDLCVFPEDDDETTEDSDDEETEEFEVQKDDEDDDMGNVFFNQTLSEGQVIAIKLTLNQTYDQQTLQKLVVRVGVEERTETPPKLIYYVLLIGVIVLVFFYEFNQADKEKQAKKADIEAEAQYSKLDNQNYELRNQAKVTAAN